MGFVRERVSREDWELYNSFELVCKTGEKEGKKDFADEYSSWYVDKDNEAYFIMTGALGREEVRYYTLVIAGKKINITACLERRFGKEMQKGYRITEIIADKNLKNLEKEFLTMIKEALQVGWRNKLNFIDCEEIVYRDEVR